MTITEFKKIYTEINPNANVFNYENDAERRFLGINFRILYYYFLGIFLMFDIDHNGKKKSK
jgi:hypothetical protein